MEKIAIAIAFIIAAASLIGLIKAAIRVIKFIIN